MITTDGENEPIVNIIEPNPALASCSELPAGKIPDMIILHEKDSHYNLIIHESSRLALEGGLDYQRTEEKKKIEEKKQEKIDVLSSSKINDDFKKNLVEKIAVLEERCRNLEVENRGLISRLKTKDKERDDEVIIDLEEENILLSSKLSGFQRANPQVQSEEKKKKHHYQCEKCDYILDSEVLLNAHMKSHEKKQSLFKCNVCEDEFRGKLQLERHIKSSHKEEEIIKETRQYNCEDCSFQGENGLELKKHIQRTKHCPSDYSEKCYTCEKEFSSYWHLMNHRKMEHPSNKKCRYYQTEACRFDSETCWYIHAIESPKGLYQNKGYDNSCDQCAKMFESKLDLMKHRKTEHSDKVAKCINFAQGNCSFTESSCWFMHDEGRSKMDMHIGNEHESEVKEQVFQEARDKSPPDFVAKIMNLIETLSIQVGKLEKNSMNQ